MNNRRIAVILVDRANYGRIKPVLSAIQNHSDLEMQIICSGTMLLERFGNAINQVENDGFEVIGRVYIELEGSVPLTMAKSLGFAVGEFASELNRLRPDILLVVGDRYEALAATLAAAYLNICIAHIQGGEVSGSIDESARHAITKFAHYHFPATERSAEYIVRMGENPETVFMVGCPCSDVIAESDLTLSSTILNRQGVGSDIDVDKDFLLVVFHPVTTSFGNELEQVANLFEALKASNLPVCWIWPNIDAGSDHISKFLRRQREFENADHIRFVKNYSPEDYIRVLKNASCLVGNSSSFIRESNLLGVPVVLIGDRQQGREMGANIIRVDPETELIIAAISKQLSHGPYRPSTLYGDGKASQRIAKYLSEIRIYTQKTLNFVFEMNKSY